jgi:hypothetical protein
VVGGNFFRGHGGGRRQGNREVEVAPLMVVEASVSEGGGTPGNRERR